MAEFKQAQEYNHHIMGLVLKAPVEDTITTLRLSSSDTFTLLSILNAHSEMIHLVEAVRQMVEARPLGSIPSPELYAHVVQLSELSASALMWQDGADQSIN